MTSKDDSTVAATNSMKPHRDRIHQERTRKNLHEDEPEKGVGTSGGTYKESKAPACNCRYWFFLYVLCSMHALLFVVPFIISDLELASIRRPYPSESLRKETHGAANMPTSLWHGTDSSSLLPSSHATPVASATAATFALSPQDQSLVNILSNACSSLLERSSETREPVIETVVCKNRESVCSAGDLLISLFRRRQSS